MDFALPHENLIIVLFIFSVALVPAKKFRLHNRPCVAMGLFLNKIE